MRVGLPEPSALLSPTSFFSSMTWNRFVSRAFSRSTVGNERYTVPLAYTSLGDGAGKPIVILHGLLCVLRILSVFGLRHVVTHPGFMCRGSKRNWNSISKALHRTLVNRPIYTLDLRNHGASPHARPMTYQAMPDIFCHGLICHRRCMRRGSMISKVLALG